MDGMAFIDMRLRYVDREKNVRAYQVPLYIV